MGLRADVLERLRTMPGMSPSRRQEALAAAQRCPENPWRLNDLARDLVKLPGGEMSGYRKALGYIEEACQLEAKNGLSLNTLGVAYYRVGNYEKAMETLLRSDQINNAQFQLASAERPSNALAPDSDQINKAQSQGLIAADIAFLAMTQQQLGHAKEAQAELQRLRERMKDPHWAQDAECRASCAKPKRCWQNPRRPAASNQAWAARGRVRVLPGGVSPCLRNASKYCDSASVSEPSVAVQVLRQLGGAGWTRIPRPDRLLFVLVFLLAKGMQNSG